MHHCGNGEFRCGPARPDDPPRDRSHSTRYPRAANDATPKRRAARRRICDEHRVKRPGFVVDRRRDDAQRRRTQSTNDERCPGDSTSRTRVIKGYSAALLRIDIARGANKRPRLDDNGRTKRDILKTYFIYFFF